MDSTLYLGIYTYTFLQREKNQLATCIQSFCYMNANAFVFANRRAHIVIYSCLLIHVSFSLHFLSYLHVNTCNPYGRTMEIEVHSVAVVNAGFGASLSQFQVHGWLLTRLILTGTTCK